MNSHDLNSPVAWGQSRFIHDIDGRPIGTDDPYLSWGNEAPEDIGWFPLYAAPICPTAEWQPIETAPKDGKRFIAATLIPNHRMVIAMRGVAGILLDEQCQPLPWPMTHWMPLPAAPEYKP